jgi:uncharacterized beta-barrel protein YwiB (DUF1934 family)
MNRDVVVSVTGFHSIDGDSNQISLVAPGSYFEKNGKHYLIYDELVEGENDPVRCTVRVSGDGRHADIVRGNSGRLEFEPGKTTMCCYSTPYGPLYLTISTSGVSFSLTEEKYLLKIDYTVEVNEGDATAVHAAVEAKPRIAEA